MMAEIAVMGHGVVGSGVMEVLISHKDSIAKRAKEEVHVKHIPVSYTHLDVYKRQGHPPGMAGG